MTRLYRKIFARGEGGEKIHVLKEIILICETQIEIETQYSLFNFSLFYLIDKHQITYDELKDVWNSIKFSF